MGLIKLLFLTFFAFSDSSVDNKLIDAVTHGESAIVIDALMKGADVEVQTQEGLNVFHLIAMNGSTKTAKVLIDEAYFKNVLLELLNENLRSNGKTPLDLAVISGHSEVAYLFALAGANTLVSVMDSKPIKSTCFDIH